MKEEQLSKVICQVLDLQKVYYFHPANEGKRSKYMIRHFHNSGGRAGVADLVLLLKGGETVFVELKTETGRPRKSQLEFKATVENLGFDYQIWRSADDAINYLNKKGFKWIQ